MFNNSFILNSKATYYVYNNKSKFIDLWITLNNDVLYIKKSIIFIKSFGIIIKELKQYTLYLYNIVLILLFYINITLLRLFII